MEGSGKKSYKLLYLGIAALIVVAVGYLVVNNAFSSSASIGKTISTSDLTALYNAANNQSIGSSAGISAYVGLTPSQYIRNGTQKNLTLNGKPALFYIGADYCPYCAATRWPVILALMRFGNFTGLEYMESSPTDVYKNTPTFTFVNSTYTSKYLSFMAVEVQDRKGAPLQPLNGTPAELYDKYANGIPFLYFGNGFFSAQGFFLPNAFQGNNWGSIISQLSFPNSTVSQDVIGATNIYTAQICKMINNTAPVCSQGYVTQAANRFLG